MANKDLRYFMREEAKVEQIVTVPGPESIKDENGKVIQLEIKQLHNDTTGIRIRFQRNAWSRRRRWNGYEKVSETEWNDRGRRIWRRTGKSLL